jgi:hypothetical protein
MPKGDGIQKEEGISYTKAEGRNTKRKNDQRREMMRVKGGIVVELNLRRETSRTSLYLYSI